MNLVLEEVIIGKFACGERDIIVPPRMVEANASALGGQAVLIRYEDCGHSPFVDVPDRVAENVRMFFGEAVHGDVN